jgi:hypothetical protein
MASPSVPSAGHRAALIALAADLRRIFGVGLHALVAYGLARRLPDEPVHALALVQRVTFEDLAACAPVVEAWRSAGLAVPLLISRKEFERTLDVFPLEYDAILRDHTVIEGADPFAGLKVGEPDLRRACEEQAKSHLIHLREAFLEGSRDPQAVANLIAASAPVFRTVLLNIARLDGEADTRSDESLAALAERQIGIHGALVAEVLAFGRSSSAAADSTALFARYLAASEQIWKYVDGWRVE